MKICAIQIPYGRTKEETENSVEFLVKELESCDSSLDLILTPEYSNCPGGLPPEEALSFSVSHTEKLEDAAVRAAKRCGAIVALSGCFGKGDAFRNTTRLYHADGTVAGEYYKQQLVPREGAEHGVTHAYTGEYNPPPIFVSNGIRFGFLTCYDTYFEEYIAHLAAKKPDVVLVSSFQRGEDQDILRAMNKLLAFQCNAFVLRASVSMGEKSTKGGTSLIVDPSGKILADMGQGTGKLVFEIGDVRRKHFRPDSFGGKEISNWDFLQQGRTPRSYRACGSCVKEGDEKMPYPRVCAHRGFKTIAPENSLPAFGAAIALGADEIEFDVRFTADGVPVSVHDHVLERVSNGTGRVEEKTFEELLKLDFGAKASSPSFAGLKILTVEEILMRFPRQAVLNIHIKSTPGEKFSRENLKKVTDLLEKYDCSAHAYFMGDPEVMEAAMEVAPHIRRCMAGGATEESKYSIVERALEWNCHKVQFFKPCITQAMVDKAHANNILCNVFWSDDPAEAEKFLEMGIDTILSNDYFRIAQVRDSFVRRKGRI
ncbi:MAG: hypothetical protein J6A21_00490 [Lentisphaeria bacterium]|nr:hypothetical protein [Lentisphaeria bacterium]